MQAPVVVMSEFSKYSFKHERKPKLNFGRHAGRRQTSGSQSTIIKYHSSKDVSKRKLESKSEAGY